MKLQLIGLAIALSLSQQSFSASKEKEERYKVRTQSLTNVQLSAELVAASPFLKAAHILGELQFSDRLFFPIIGENSLDYLNQLTNSSRSLQERFQFLLTLPPDELGRLAISAEQLRLDGSFQDPINQALVQKICKNPSTAMPVEELLVPYPLAKLSLIKTLTESIAYKKTYPVPPLADISLNPTGTKLLTVHKDQLVTLWEIDHSKQTLNLITDIEVSQKRNPTKKAYFSSTGNYICLVANNGIIIVDARTLKPEHAYYRKLDHDHLKTVVFSPNDSRYTLLSTASPAETFGIEGEKIDTSTPDGDNGIFDCFTYHPEHQYNNLVATFQNGQPCIKLWNLLTGNVVNRFVVDRQPSAIQQLFLLEKMLLAQEPSKTIKWEVDQKKNPEGKVVEEYPGQIITNAQVSPLGIYSVLKASSSETNHLYCSQSHDCNCSAIGQGEEIMIQFGLKQIPQTVMAALALVQIYKK